MNEFKSVLNEVRKVINGKDREIIITMLALLANGNILIEDIPGVGKTTMALAFSKALGLKYGRIQFTPDTLPSDITGFSSFNKESGKCILTKELFSVICFWQMSLTVLQAVLKRLCLRQWKKGKLPLTDTVISLKILFRNCNPKPCRCLGYTTFA